MEADLRRYYGIDYRDRYRRDENGWPRLTLRQIAVFVRHLPPDAAVVIALNDGDPGWTRLERFVADLFQAWSGQEHPALTAARGGRKPGVQPDDLAAARARAEERKRRIEKGEIT